MIATDFQRDDCLLGKKRVSYAKLRREYRCAECGHRLVMRYRYSTETGWIIDCGRCCGGDFIHEYEYERQRQKHRDALANLPAEIVEAYHNAREEMLKCQS